MKKKEKFISISDLAVFADDPSRITGKVSKERAKAMAHGEKSHTAEFKEKQSWTFIIIFMVCVLSSLVYWFTP